MAHSYVFSMAELLALYLKPHASVTLAPVQGAAQSLTSQSCLAPIFTATNASEVNSECLHRGRHLCPEFLQLPPFPPRRPRMSCAGGNSSAFQIEGMLFPNVEGFQKTGGPGCRPVRALRPAPVLRPLSLEKTQAWRAKG